MKFPFPWMDRKRWRCNGKWDHDQATWRDPAPLESLEPRQLPAATLPTPFTFMSGHHDAAEPHFTSEVVPHFNVVGGTSGNPSIINAMKAKGTLYSSHVHNTPGASSSQLFAT